MKLGNVSVAQAIVGSVILCASTCAIVVAQNQLLDLTQPAKPARPEHERQSRSIGASASTGDRTKAPRSWSLKMRLLRFDQTKYVVGEPFTYDVELEALQEVTIPWSVERDAADPEGRYEAPQFRYMWIRLHSESSQGQPLAAAGFAYGSALLQGSLRTLQPGEKVRVRIGGHWEFLTPEMNRVMPDSINVRAILSPAVGDLLLASITSENALSVSTKR